MLEYYQIALVISGIITYALFSRKIENSLLTLPMVFAAFGWFLGTGGTGLVPVTADHGSIHLLAELTLVLVLFSDASRVRLKSLEREYSLPVRMLFLGLPASVLLGTFFAYWLVAGGSWALALLVAAILSPTDAALAQVVVSNKQVPERLRQGLNVESGLNDGLVLPLVTVGAMLAADAQQVSWEGIARFVMLQITLGVLIGLVVGYLFARLLDWSAKRELATEVFEGIYFMAMALLTFVVAEMLGGNGFIAAFTGGFVFGNLLKSAPDFVREFMESEGQLLTIFTFFVFGAVLLPVGIDHVSWESLFLSLGFITLVRIVPVMLSLTGTGLTLYERFFLGWFGPRGIASILFALLILEEYQVPGAHEVFACVVVTVGLSIVLHGVSGVPMVRFLTKK